MAHGQRPDFVFRRKVRVHLNQRGRQFSRLLAAEVYTSALVMLDTPHSEVAWDYWLPTPFASFPFTSPPVYHRVLTGFKRTLPHHTTHHTIPRKTPHHAPHHTMQDTTPHCFSASFNLPIICFPFLVLELFTFAAGTSGIFFPIKDVESVMWKKDVGTGKQLWMTGIIKEN